MHTKDSIAAADSQAAPPNLHPLGEIAYISPDEQRAYDALVKDYKVLKVPDYFLDEWVQLMGAAEAWLALSFRQLAFVSRSQQATGEQLVRVTLRDLAKWSGISFQHVTKVLRKAQYLHWFVRREDGQGLGEHRGQRSEAPTYLVRIEVPLTPHDQARLQAYLGGHLPDADEGWLQLLHRAPAAKKVELDQEPTLPIEPQSIDALVKELRDPAADLPTEIELACVELHNRWVTTNFRQVTHYFLRDWLPDLTPGLGFFITWARKHAQQEAHGQPIGQLRLSSWDVPAKAIGVAPYSVKRWVKDQGSYPHTRAFIRSVKEEYGGYGQVEEMQADSWTIGGQQVLITAESRIRDPVFVGDTVKLVATKRDDHGSHVPLVAQSLEIAMDARRPLGLSLRAFVLDVRISEPIHPADRRRYAKLRNLFGEDQSNGHTKADKTSTRSDKPRTRSDSRFTRDDTTRTKDNKRYAKTDKPQAGSDKGRTESDALRDSQKDSKDKVKKNKQLPQEARIPPQAEPHSRRRPSLAAAAVGNQWPIDRILAEAAIRDRDRKIIVGRETGNRQPFVAWLLWSLATRTIEAPVLHAISRVKRREAPPNSFLQLATTPPSALWEWLTNYGSEVPPEVREAVSSLRKLRADQRLQRLGFQPPGAGRGLPVISARTGGRIPGRESATGQRPEPGHETHIDGQPAQEIWAAALNQLQMELSRTMFDTWVRHARLVRYQDGVFEVGAQNEYARAWLEDRLKSTTERILSGILAHSAKVKFIVLEGVG